MRNIKIWNDNPSEKQIREIVEVLKEGEIVILPTDSIYAICCNALDSKAISRLCQIKNINPDKTNLSILCSDISMAAEYARIENNAFRLVKENTPGPITFLFKALSSLPRAFKGRKIVGIRIPDCRVTREVVSALGNPVLSTTIEFDDTDYVINPELIAESYEHTVDMMVTGEEGDTIPSTIIDCTGKEPEIIREGKIVPENL